MTTTDISTWNQPTCSEYIAEREKSCDYISVPYDPGVSCRGGQLHGYGKDKPMPCPRCEGSGTVPVFPTQREKCDHVRTLGQASEVFPAETCVHCKGRGWIENVTLDGLMIALIRTESFDETQIDWKKIIQAVIEGKTPLLALSRVVCAAYKVVE